MFLTCEIRTVDGKSLGVLVLQPKEFKTGSRGYFTTGKVEIDGRRYQAQVQLVEIGSKGDPPSGIPLGDERLGGLSESVDRSTGQA